MVQLNLDLENIGSIIFKMYSQQEDSDFLDTYIENNGELLGNGSYGKVYLIEDQNLDEVVVKVSYRTAIYCILSFDKFDKITKSKNFKYEKSSPNKIKLEDRDNVNRYIVQKMLDKENYFYENEKIFCESDSEYIISCCCTQLVSKGICCHFPKVYGFKKGSPLELDIKNEKIFFETKSYLFMENISEELFSALISNFKNNETTHNHNLLNGILFQLLFSIACYQRYYKIIHHDLNLRNIMVDYFKDDFLENNSELSYRVDNYIYKIKSIPFYIKIIDFGLSHKHSEPKIINDTIGLDESIFSRHKNEYIPLTDIVFFMVQLKNYLQNHLNYEHPVVNNVVDKYSSFYTDGYIFENEVNNIIEERYKIFYGTKNKIPYVTAEDILKENILDLGVKKSIYQTDENFLGILN